jgi:hypothetical protein
MLSSSHRISRAQGRASISAMPCVMVACACFFRQLLHENRLLSICCKVAVTRVVVGLIASIAYPCSALPRRGLPPGTRHWKTRPTHQWLNGCRTCDAPCVQHAVSEFKAQHTTYYPQLSTAYAVTWRLCQYSRVCDQSESPIVGCHVGFSVPVDGLASAYWLVDGSSQR